MPQIWEWFSWFICGVDRHAGAVQAISAVVTLGLTAALVGATWRYVGLTNRLATSSRQQLLFLAHPNVLVVTNVVSEKEARIVVKNCGIYPFRLGKCKVRGEDANGEAFTMELKELDARIVGGNTSTHVPVFFHMPLNTESVQCGSFEDFLCIEFDCEDVIGLVKSRYRYRRIDGLREILQY